MLRFKDIKQESPEKALRVEGNPVWDYKLVEGKLYLISKPYAEFSWEKDRVTVGELTEYVGAIDCDVYCENSRSQLRKNQISFE